MIKPRTLLILFGFVVLILLAEAGYYFYLRNLSNKGEGNLTDLGVNNQTDMTLTQMEQDIYQSCGLGKNIDTRGFLIKAEFLKYIPEDSQFEVKCKQSEVVSFDKETSFKIVVLNKPVSEESDLHSHGEVQLVDFKTFFNSLKDGDDLQINVSEINGKLIARSVVKLVY